SRRSATAHHVPPSFPTRRSSDLGRPSRRCPPITGTQVDPTTRRWAMGEPHKVTIGDVARHAGVSKGTVSLAYSGKRPVSPETRRRVFAAAEQLKWTASHRARALATSRTGTIGLVVARDPDVLATDPFFAKFIGGCESVLAEHGMGLMLHAVTSKEAELAVYERLASGRVDGVILLDVEVDDHRFALVQQLG